MPFYLRSILALAVATTLGASLLWGIRPHRELTLFPTPSGSLFSYDDRSAGGASRVMTLERKDEGMRFSFTLGPAANAYVGAGAELSAPGTYGQGVDLRDFETLELSFRASAPVGMKLVLMGFDPRLWKSGDYLTLRYSEARLPHDASVPVRIALRDLALAGWWIDRGLVPPTDTNRALDHVVGFQILAVPGTRLDSGGTDTIFVQSIHAESRRPLAGRWIWWLPVLAWGGWGGIFFRRRKTSSADFTEDSDTTNTREPLPSKGVASPPQPVSLDIGNESDEILDRLTSHLAANYHRCDLDADTICRETGIPRSRLPEILRTGYATTFKAYLNELRLTEASRLLQTTDRTISEIAFAVGYNGMAHFNRVFREKFGMAPGEYRHAQMKASTHPAGIDP